jgi:predicted acylesterase/phospholipase RssA
MGKKLKVAFAMGGGASLGAFSGGAIAEVLRQLRMNLDRSVYDTVEIDVLSGASAGGMTLGLLVRGLADPGNDSDGVAVERVRDLMKRAWVDEIDIERLVPRPDMTDRASLFDRGAVDAIARDVISWRDGEEPRPRLLADRVCLGLTLLNYNGIPISLSPGPALDDALSTTLYRDYRVFCLDFGASARAVPSRWLRFDAPALKRPKAWRSLAATMIAGGAVPLAFEPVILERRRSEFGPLWPEDLEQSDTFPFTHGDGGTFDNEPLRQAMRLIRFMDAPEAAGTYDRVLVSIDPNVSGSTHDLALEMNRALTVNPDYGLFDGEDVVPTDYAGRLLQNASRALTTIRGEASFKDYLGADKVNNRLRWRDDARGLIAELIDAVDPDRAPALLTRAEASLRGVLANKRAVSLLPGGGLTVEDEVQRVGAETVGGRGSEKDPSMGGSNERLRCVLLSLVDQVADLRGKEPVSVWAIAPTSFLPVDGGPGDSVPVDLAGDFVGSFGGFLDRSFRSHDFELGVALAGSSLASPPVSGPLGVPLLADPRQRAMLPPRIDAKLSTNEKARRRFADRLGHVAAAVFRDKVHIRSVRTLVAPMVRRAIARLVRDKGERQIAAQVRLLVHPDSVGSQRFHLTGAAGGDDTESVGVGIDGVVAVDTVVRFTVRGTASVDGPHVHVRDHGWVLLLRETRPLHGDPVLEISLPALDSLRKESPRGLPIHTLHVDWPVKPKGVWSVESGLIPLEAEL